MRRILTALLLSVLVIIVIEAKPVHATSNVIYGSSTGLPADATIKQVAFSRSGDDLVTSFQVQGRISVSDYTYAIGARFGSAYEGHTPYWIGLSSYKAFANKAVFYETATQTATDVRFEIAGDTWTSWTPISLLKNKVHLWVWAGTEQWSSSQAQWNWVDSLLASGYGGAFEITLPAKVTLTLQPSTIANKVTLTVDGTQSNFDTSGQLSLMMDAGTSHSLTTTPTIQTSDNTRYVFGSWSDYGSQSTRTLSVEQDSSLSVTYTRQFLLTASSDFGTVSGGGWYDEGSSASFSVQPSQVRYSGFLGMLNVQYQFTGWTGDVASVSASSSVSMDGPKTVQAKWTTVRGPLFIALIVGLIVGVPLIALAAFLLHRRRWEEKKRGVGEAQTVTVEAPSKATEMKHEVEERVTPPKTRKGRKSKIRFCSQCGTKITPDSKFCKECGNPIIIRT